MEIKRSNWKLRRIYPRRRKGISGETMKNVEENKSFLSKKFVFDVRLYVKYAHLCSRAANKIFRNRIKLFRFADAIFESWSDINSFVDELGLVQRLDNYIRLDDNFTHLIDILSPHLNKKLLKVGSHTTYYDCEIGDSKILLSHNSYRNATNDAFCYKGSLDDVANNLRELFWKAYSNNVIVGFNKDSYGEEKSLSVRRDENFGTDAFHSKEYFDALSYIRDFYNYGKNRAIIFYGNPGVGKSTIIRQIASKLGAKTIRVNLDAFDKFDTESILDIVRILKPQCLIIDDFDKLELSKSMLPIFERLHRHIKLTMISVNNLNYFEKNEALIRPGRFDKFIKVERLDDYVISQILGEKNLHLIEKVRQFPAAFISELKDNIDVLGEEIAEKCIKELEERIKHDDE